MNTETLLKIATDALNNLKAIDITVFDVHEMTSITDRMVICSGRSTRHVKSLASELIQTVKANKVKWLRAEGEKNGEWVIVDLGDVVVHIMLPAMRDFYRLEDLWQPVETARHNKNHP